MRVVCTCVCSCACVNAACHNAPEKVRGQSQVSIVTSYLVWDKPYFSDADARLAAPLEIPLPFPGKHVDFRYTTASGFGMDLNTVHQSFVAGDLPAVLPPQVLYHNHCQGFTDGRHQTHTVCSLTTTTSRTFQLPKLKCLVSKHKFHILSIHLQSAGNHLSMYCL